MLRIIIVKFASKFTELVAGRLNTRKVRAGNFQANVTIHKILVLKNR